MIHTWEKGKHFLVKAGTYILAVSILTWFLLNLPWGVENKKDSYLGKVGQVMAPALMPLGFGHWAAAASLTAGLVAKEIVVGTMGEIYVQQQDAKQKDVPSFSDDLKEVGTSFAGAAKSSLSNVISTFGITSISAEGSAEKTAEHNTLREVLKNQFTPLSAYAFITFVLLNMPCVIAQVAMVQELGTWKWYGVALAYQMVPVWGVSALIYIRAESCWA